MAELRGGSTVGGKRIEDTIGSQAKADKAYNDAYNKAYTDVLSWAKGFGLGDVAKDISSTDLNSLDATGFYKGTSLTNAPTTNAVHVWAIINIKVSNTGRMQLAVLVTDGNNTQYQRSQAGGAWSAWTQTETTTGAQAKVDTHANKTDNPHAVTKAQVGLANVDNVQQASKTEFTTHTSDTVVHITSTERTAWNSAETNAKDYAWALTGVKIVDNRSVSPLPTDYEKNRTTAEFKYASSVGLSGLAVDPYVHVFTERAWGDDSGGYIRQTAYDGESTQMFVRYGVASTNTWSAWDVLETVAGSQEKANTAESNAKSASVPLTDKGVANGVATLDSTGKVPQAQLNIEPPVDATTTQKGIVMLEDSTTSTSTTTASTPNSVKTVNDRITSELQNYYTITTANQKFTAKYVGDIAPDTTTLIAGDTWYNATSGVFSIWNGTAWGELSMNNPKGTVNFNTNNARLVIPVGIDKWAT